MNKKTIKTSLALGVITISTAIGGYYYTTDKKLENCYLKTENNICYKTENDLIKAKKELRKDLKNTDKANTFMELCKIKKDSECIEEFNLLVKKGIESLKDSNNPKPINYNEHRVMIELSKEITIYDFSGSSKDLLKTYLQSTNE